jgi:hypothetical protein
LAGHGEASVPGSKATNMVLPGVDVGSRHLRLFCHF